MAMKNIAVIGLGTICEHYLKAFNTLNEYKVVATCDLNENAYSKNFFDCPFFSDYKQLINLDNLNFVVISTPPSTHFEIAAFFLEHNIGVLLEKPATTNYEDLVKLIELSKNHNTFFKVMYHWQFGSEILKFNELYDPKYIESINVCVYDDYSIDGCAIKPSKIGLGGAFIDSGINVLSMIKCWLPFNNVVLLGYESKRCNQSNLVIKADVDLLIDGVNLHICIDWTTKKSNKETSLVYKGRKIDINNLLQTIYDGDNVINVEEMNRLDAHYYNLFRLFVGEPNYSEETKLHSLLFDINEKL